MEEEEDKMSQVPDDILLLILDKIDTFEAAKTTILSHRWKNLWCLLPSLRFHLSCTGHYSEFNDLIIRFSHMVSRCLTHRDSAVHDFHLSFDVPWFYQADTEFVEECVLYAINHGFQSLRLHANSILELPQALLSCKTLRELELGQSCFVSVPGRLSLPNLKTLHLECMLSFPCDATNMEPFSGLPELEKLTLIDYSIDGLIIKSPKLRVLEITTSCNAGVKEIYTPLLTSFRYESDGVWDCENVNLPMLEQVYLDIHETRPWYNYQHRFVRMLHQFRNATTVSLTLDTLRVLEFNGEHTSPPPFPNMKCLKVIEGRYGIRTVFQGVMNYMMGTLYCEVEFPPNVIVVEQIFDCVLEEEEDD